MAKRKRGIWEDIYQQYEPDPDKTNAWLILLIVVLVLMFIGGRLYG